MLFLPIIFLSPFLFAQEELQLETYCFSSGEARASVEKKVTPILIPSDKLTSERNCMTVQMKPHRRELIQNYLRNLDPEMRVTFSSAELKREPCLLEVEKVRASQSADSAIQVSDVPGAAASEKKETSRDVMKIQTLSDFSFTVRQDVIEGKCRFITKDRYEISISARRDPKPMLPPNLPPGAIVSIPVPPEEQKTLSVSTTLQLNRGERTEIGSIVRDLRRKDQKIDVRPEAKLETAEGQEEEKVFLSFQ